MEIYKDLSNPASKEFEKLLNSKLSKTQIEEGKIIEGKINKITDKFVFLQRGFCFPPLVFNLVSLFSVFSVRFYDELVLVSTVHIT